MSIDRSAVLLVPGEEATVFSPPRETVLEKMAGKGEPKEGGERDVKNGKSSVIISTGCNGVTPGTRSDVCWSNGWRTKKAQSRGQGAKNSRRANATCTSFDCFTL